MTPERFRAVIDELTIENPLAVRPLLRILEVRFSDAVPTLAVTCEERPLLLVNLAFVAKHCATDAHVKAVVLHEYLHVLLRHTEKREPSGAAEHIAEDAVINAIIHRQGGSAMSSMMSRYYAEAKGIERLLRPPREEESTGDARLDAVWRGVYEGKFVVDDIRELAKDFAARGGKVSCGRLIGDHSMSGRDVRSPLARALDDALRTMNGSGIWRSPLGRGPGGTSIDHVFRAGETAVERWRRATLRVLREHVVAATRSPWRAWRESVSPLPVLSARDRRAFVRALWDPFVPEAAWTVSRSTPQGRTRIYFDVSGSIWAEIPHLVRLLGALRPYIEPPLWAFSTDVAPAVIRDGALITESTGGTSIECVLRHIGETRPAAAVIVTDGYIEPVEKEWMALAAATRVHAIVTRDGSTALLDRAGIPCTQLERLP